MKVRYLLCVALLSSGCTVGTGSSSGHVRSAVISSSPVRAVQRAENASAERKALTPIHQVAVGMSTSEVRQIMGDRFIVGFKFHEDQGSYESMEILAPYKEEVIDSEGQDYQVLYYFTQIEKEDGLVADDECTPLVFQSEKLLAKGWDAYFRYKIPL